MDKLNRKPSQYIELTCAATGEKFLKYRGEYNRQIREGVTRFFKDRTTAALFLSEEKASKTRVIRECVYCGKPFQSTTAKKARICCSRHCAAMRTHQILEANPDLKEEVRRKQSEAIKRHLDLVSKGLRKPQRHANGFRPPRTPKEIEVARTRVCQICGVSFVSRTDNKVKTCSKPCRKILSSHRASANPNCGGETNYRRYRYNEILMDSQWEVDIAIWLDDHKIIWRRDKKMMFQWTDPQGERRRYHPDFYLPQYDLYLDPKNKYLIEKDRFKIEAVMKEHNIKIIWGLRDDVLSALEGLVSQSNQSQV